jgi:hypothetical protein
MKNSNDTIGNRTRDLPACCTVPQPTALPRGPVVVVVLVVFVVVSFLVVVVVVVVLVVVFVVVFFVLVVVVVVVVVVLVDFIFPGQLKCHHSELLGRDEMLRKYLATS